MDFVLVELQKRCFFVGFVWCQNCYFGSLCSRL